MISPASAERILLLASVASEGSMTAAADEVGYSVSAVSQQIRKLEQEAGIPLIQRHSRGIYLTDAGRAVVEHAERISGQMRSLQNSLDAIQGLQAGQLRMGTFPTAGASLVPNAINSFRNSHPLVGLNVKSVRVAPLLNMLSTHELTLSLLWEYPWSPIERTHLDVSHLMDDRLDLVVAHSHRLAHRDRVAMRELVDEDWVIRAGNHPIVEAIIRAVNKVGFEPQIAYEANDYQEAQAMVAVGLGIALVPRLALSVMRNDVQVIPLRGVVPRRRILLARPADAVKSPAESEMAKILSFTAHEMEAIP